MGYNLTRGFGSHRIAYDDESGHPGGVRLKEIAGWNQTAADWKRFLEASPQGCFVAEHDGRLCGTATTISFENRLAWIGMVLVDPEYRGQGIGTKLLARAIEYLNDLKIAAIKLDATPQGKPLYENYNSWPNTRLSDGRCGDLPPRRRKRSGLDSREPLSQEFLESIFEADKESFGADRSSLLKSLHRDAPEFTAGFGMRVRSRAMRWAGEARLRTTSVPGWPEMPLRLATCSKHFSHDPLAKSWWWIV